MAYSSKNFSRKILYSSVRCMLVWKLVNYEQKMCPAMVSTSFMGLFFSIGLMQSVVEDVSRSRNLLGFSKYYYFNLVSGNFLVKCR